jgi:uncharacterized protein involved in response to NO
VEFPAREPAGIRGGTVAASGLTMLDPSTLRREPFRLFFPLGVLLAWSGVGHWLAYAAGVTHTYSCPSHAGVQIEGFLLAFAAGFLLTAIPRRTNTAPPGLALVALLAVLQIATAVATLWEAWRLAAMVAAAQILSLIAFAATRLSAGPARRPPPGFVLVPMALVQALAGIALMGTAERIGRLLVEQGLFLCLVMGIGSLVVPLMAGQPPPPDLGSSPAVARQAAAYAAAGVVVVATLVAEGLGSLVLAPIVRGAVFAATIAIGGGAARWPERPGWNRALTWIALWMVPTGLVASGLAPDYRVPALHVTFIGGFGLLAFCVATHVTASHLALPWLRDGRPRVLAILGGATVLALVVRVLADATHTYFLHLGIAGSIWIVGSAVWLATLLPFWMRPPEGSPQASRR